ncbi:MAG: NifB/NifX family molybdenum-iron cluster-binding protein [Pseudomonadota bacterium]|nr:NifB/NifX family molybdenum-iron cluster-binding protein [Pseudomonadota bacterium]
MPQVIPPLRGMKIAVTCQNRKTVTGHAGKCRKFWVYEVEGRVVLGRNLLELPIEESFHASSHDAPHPLDDVNVLISGGMGFGLQNRLKQKGILAVATSETDPDRAVAAWLDGCLPEAAPEAHDHEHGHGHGHSHDQQAIAFLNPLRLTL